MEHGQGTSRCIGPSPGSATGASWAQTDGTTGFSVGHSSDSTANAQADSKKTLQSIQMLVMHKGQLWAGSSGVEMGGRHARCDNATDIKKY